MAENPSNIWSAALTQLVQVLLRLSTFRVALLLVIAAVFVAMMMILAIDFLWDGRFSAELEFAAVVTAILDSLLIIGLLVTPLLATLRNEVGQRQTAEEALRLLNEELEDRIRERTQQLKQAQEELVRKEKLALLGQVADTVGHELRNPLGVMNNAVYFLQTVLVDADETTREYLGIIKEEIARCGTHRLRPAGCRAHQAAAAGNGGGCGLISHALGKCAVPPAVTVRMDIPENAARHPG